MIEDGLMIHEIENGVAMAWDGIPVDDCPPRSKDEWRVSLILAELAEGEPLSIDDLTDRVIPPEDRIRSIQQTCYRLMRQLERQGIVREIEPRPGEHQWRWEMDPYPPDSWCSIRVPEIPPPPITAETLFQTGTIGVGHLAREIPELFRDDDRQLYRVIPLCSRSERPTFAHVLRAGRCCLNCERRRG